MKKHLFIMGSIFLVSVILSAFLYSSVPNNCVAIKLTDSQVNSIRSARGGSAPITLTPEQVGIIIDTCPGAKIKMSPQSLSINANAIIDDNNIPVDVSKIEVSVKVYTLDLLGSLSPSPRYMGQRGARGSKPRVELTQTQLNSIPSRGGMAASVQFNQTQLASLFNFGGWERAGIIIINGKPGGSTGQKGIIIVNGKDIKEGNLLVLSYGEAKIFLNLAK